MTAAPNDLTDDVAAALAALAADRGQPVAADAVIAGESELFRGYLVVDGPRYAFVWSRFGAWEVAFRFTAAEASGVEVRESFAGDGCELRLILGGLRRRICRLDGDAARQLARGMVAAGAAVGGGPRRPPERAARRTAAAAKPVPSPTLALAAPPEPARLDVTTEGRYRGSAVAGATASPPVVSHPWGGQAAAASPEEVAEPLEISDLELVDEPVVEVEASPSPSVAPLSRGIAAGFLYVIVVFTAAEFSELVDPEVLPFLPWICVALPGGLVAGFGRTVASLLYGGFTAFIVTQTIDGFHGLQHLEFFAFLGWWLLGFVSITFRGGTGTYLWSALIALPIVAMTEGDPLLTLRTDIGFQVGLFWGLHALVERGQMVKKAAKSG